MKKWFAPALVYSGVAIGLFLIHNAWGALLLFHVAILVSLIIFRSDVPVTILFTSKNLKLVLISVLLCGSAGIPLYFFWDKFGVSENVSSQVGAMGLTGSTWIPFIAYFVLANPFIEEYFWRGYLGSKSIHVSPSDFLYAGFHGLILMNKVQTSLILYSLALLILAGWFWRQIARLDGGLLAPVLGHMAADLTILLAVYKMI